MARAAWYFVCDAADFTQMLVISLLTGGAATAAGCALEIGRASCRERVCMLV